MAVPLLSALSFAIFIGFRVQGFVCRVIFCSLLGFQYS